MINSFLFYWKFFDKKDPDDKDKKDEKTDEECLVYVGKWGDEKRDGHSALWTNIRYKNQKERVNLAIVRIYDEQEFLDNVLIKFIEILNELEILNGDFYNKIKYGTSDENTITLIKNGFSFGLVEIHNQIEHIGADGKHYLVTHGDLFDGITRLAPWIAFLGDKAFFVLSVIALFATANTVLILIIVGSRMLYGVCKDGYFPPALVKVNEKHGTPHIATLVFMVFSLLFLFFGDIGFIANVASLGAFTTFFLVNASLIILRFKKPDLERSFKTPVNIGRFPLLALLGMVSTLVMIAKFETSVLAVFASMIILGIIFHYIVKRKI